MVVVFRVTESKKDVFTDLNISPNVHSGFLKQFLSVKEAVTEDIDKYENIIFCGHSLGVALATISSLYFYYFFEKQKKHKMRYIWKSKGRRHCLFKII